LSVAKLDSPVQNKTTAGGKEVSIMDDSPADIGVPSAASEDALSEAHPAAAMQVGATPESSETVTVEATTESAQTLALATNGSSPRRIEANRRNAKKSTGPKTSVGKAMSSWNSQRHGLLSKRLPTIYGQGKKKQFTRLLTNLQRDLEPIGTLEEVLVEKIAQEYWRLGVAAWYEAEAFTREKPFQGSTIPNVLRYQTTINRQLFQAMNQLERLQRLRKGDNVPAPLNLEVFGEPSTLSEQENSHR
jgi:hypothetical protein